MTNVDPKAEKVDIVQNKCQKLSDDEKPISHMNDC